MISPHEKNINSGAAGLILRIGERLIKAGNKVDFLFRKDLKYFFRNPAYSVFFEFPSKIRKYISEKKHEIVDIYGHSGFLVSKMNRINWKYIFRTGGLDTRYFYEYYKVQEELRLQKYSWKFKYRSSRIFKREKIAIKNANGIIVMCNQDLNYIKNKFKQQPKLITAIPPGHYGIPKSINSYNQREGDILVVAWYGETKGFRYVNSALEKLIRNNPTLKITYAATVKTEEEIRKDLPKNLVNNIRIIPSPAHDDIINFMDNHKIFLLPSLFEGYGMAYLEAMSRGMVIIATKTGGASELIIDGENGYLIQKRNIQEIVYILNKILNNKIKWKSVSSNACNSVSNLTWDNTAEQTLKFYKEVLNSNG